MKRLVVFIFVFFSIQPAVCQIVSQWQEDNPYQLYARCYSQFINDSIGWVIPTYGTANYALFKTTNGGQDWSAISMLKGNPPANKPFVFTNQDTGYYFIQIGFYYNIYKTTDGGINWEQKYAVSYLSSIKDYFFLNSDIGWFVQNNYSPYRREIFKTTDGGTTWILINTSTYEDDYRDYITFFDENIGYLLLTGSYGSRLNKTTDGGITWNTVATKSNRASAISFRDINNGFAAMEGDLYKITNGGQTWSLVSSLNNSEIELVKIYNNNVVATGTNSGFNYIYISTDLGSTWNFNTHPFPSTEILVSIYGITFSSENKIFFNFYQSMSKSTDYGQTLNKVPIGPTFNLEGIVYFLGIDPIAIGWKYDSLSNKYQSAIISYPPLWRTKSNYPDQKFKCITSNISNDIFIGGYDYSGGGNSIIYKTDISGENLQVKYNSSDQIINSISFSNESLGYAVCDGGIILKTSDGGNSWFQLINNFGENLNFIAFNNELGFICGDNGILLKSTDSGMSWDVINIGVLNKLNSVCIQDQNRIWVVGDEGLILFSLNGGNQWSSISSYNEYNFNSVIAIDRWNIGILGGKISDNSNFFLESHNGGTTWQERGYSYLKSIKYAMANTRVAWAVGDSGTIIVTYSWFLPVELISFNASITQNKVQLNWETATELNNNGFEVQRKLENSDWITIGFVQGKGTTSEPTSYSYSDDVSDFISNKIYYRLKQIDYNGNYEFSDEIEVITLPLEYSLSQNYPNPFNPVTTIKYEIPEKTNVKLEVFDILGNRIATLVNEEKPAGRYEATFDGVALSSGVYIYKLQSGDFVSSKKMILLK